MTMVLGVARALRDPSSWAFLHPNQGPGLHIDWSFRVCLVAFPIWHGQQICAFTTCLVLYVWVKFSYSVICDILASRDFCNLRSVSIWCGVGMPQSLHLEWTMSCRNAPTCFKDWSRENSLKKNPTISKKLKSLYKHQFISFFSN